MTLKNNTWCMGVKWSEGLLATITDMLKGCGLQEEKGCLMEQELHHLLLFDRRRIKVS